MSNDHWPSTRLSLLLQLQDPTADAAWENFVDRYRPSICRFVRDVFRLQDAEAEDIAQVVLLKTVSAMQHFSYDSTHRFRSWLRTVTRNAVRDALRCKRVRHDEASGGSGMLHLLEDHPEQIGQLEMLLIESLYEDLMPDAETVVQHRVESHTWLAYKATASGRSARNVAAELQMSTAAVYKAKSKVTRMLEQELAALLTKATS